MTTSDAEIQTKQAVQMMRYIFWFATRGQTVSSNRLGALVLAFIEDCGHSHL